MRVALALLLLLACPVLSQERRVVQAVVPARGPLSSRIVFLVDVSGSMKPRRLSEAIQGCLEILNAPTDQLSIRVLAFRGPSTPGVG